MKFVLNQVDRSKGRYIDLEEWVIATRRAQGLPDHVEDPARVARLLGED